MVDFSQCTDTIIRQVGDIGRMVDEFTSFARMPAPKLKPEDICNIIRQEVFSQKVTHTEIDYLVDLPEAAVIVRCDSRQISQVLTNVLKNAAEAIAARSTPVGEPGRIQITLELEGGSDAIVIADNGRGLPVDDRERLTEPYVTTREHGTGLGLAIVRKIMEDHGGGLILEDGEEGTGARVRLQFPNLENAANSGDEQLDKKRRVAWRVTS